MTEKEIIAQNKTNVTLGKSPKGYGFTYFAKKDFGVGEIIVHGFGKILDHQTGHCSVQIKMDRHYLPNKWTGKYWNHSCEPNSYMNTRKDGFPTLYAFKKIKKGEEITYSYWMSEYSWVKNADEVKIKCACGEKKCKGKIFAFSQLDKNEQRMVIKKNLCAEYLKKIYQQK